MTDIYTLDPHMIDFARRALKCKHWTTHPPKASRRIQSFSHYPKRNQSGMLWVRESEPWSDWLPDFGDDSTLGCLLALVRKAWGCAHLSVVGDINGEWRIDAEGIQGVRDLHSFRFESEALVCALEAAP